MSDHEAPGTPPPAEDDTDDESLIDEMRDTGVGVEDPHIVGDPTPGIVDEQVAEDEPPEV